MAYEQEILKAINKGLTDEVSAALITEEMYHFDEIAPKTGQTRKLKESFRSYLG